MSERSESSEDERELDADHPLMRLARGDLARAADLRRKLRFIAERVHDEQTAKLFRRVADGQEDPRELARDEGVGELAGGPLRQAVEQREQMSREEREELDERAAGQFRSQFAEDLAEVDELAKRAQAAADHHPLA